MPDPDDAPDTVTEAVARLAELGYTDELRFAPGGLTCDVDGVEGVQPAESAVVDHQYRFEGPSDPGDEAIVLGISCPRWGRKGTLVSAFGHDADPESTAVLLALTARK